MTSLNGLSSSSASDVGSLCLEEYGEDAWRAPHVCMEPRRLRAVTNGLKLIITDGPIWSGHESALRYKHQEDVVEEEEDARRARLLEEPYTYSFLSDDDLQKLRNVLQGHVTQGSLPHLRSRVVKMFISSTFTDTQEERNALTKDVYPRLRKYCREKHGTDFLAVDMRWGVAAKASDDHSALDECMTELRNCQQHSLGPNFAVLLGQKYGSRPVAPSIVLLEFEAIRDALVKAGSDVTLLDTCYRRDINITPSLHRLQSASYLSDLLKKPWHGIAAELQSLLEQGGQLALEAGEISSDSLRRLTASVTEHEAYAGVVDVPSQKDRDKNCIVYLREIDDLLDNLEASNANRYIDLEPGTTAVSSEPYLSLKELRDKVKAKVCPRNTKVSHVRWHAGIDKERHAEYLQSMCNHFYHTAKFLVDENMRKRDKLSQDELAREVIQHWTLAMARCETFEGRQQEMARIEAYLKGEGNQALVLHGVSGSGKTSLMAKAAAVASKMAMKGPGPHRKMAVVLRFVGTTPRSSTRQQLLHSLCHQIAFITNRPRHKVPEDAKSLSVYLLELLDRGEFNGELVLLVDSLPQMALDHGASVLGWLPSRLAQNVKVIVSCVPGQQLDDLAHKIGNPEQFLEVLALPPADSESVLRALLGHHGRAVTLPQWRVLVEALQHCTLPLFLTLTVQAASRWRSYDEVQVGALQYTVEDSINALFDRLERRHGKVFVSHALAYVTATPSGLSEPELEDILSLDDEVLNSVFVLWEPPIRRLPPSLWPRLAGELSDFLVEREADGVSVLGWFHRQFVEVAVARYLQPLAQTVYTNMADYYSGTWSGERRKPFTYQPLLMKRLKLSSPESSACRYVPEQPLVYETQDGEQPRYNVRKLTQLPFCLLQSGSMARLKASCLCNYTWLYTKLKATSLQHLLADYMFIKDDIEATLVADALRMSGSALSIDPDTLGTEISGRLLTHAQRMPAIRDLILQCDLEAQRRCALVPNCQIYSAPGGPLQYECELDDSRGSVDVNVFQSPDGILLTAKPFHSATLKVWELGHGEPRQNLSVPVGESWPTKDGRHLVVLKNGRRLVVLKTCSGEVHGEIAVDYGSAHFVTLGNRYMAFTSDRGIGPSVVDLEEACLVHKFSYHSSTVAFNANEDLLLFNSGTSLLVFSLPLMERRCVTSIHNVPKQVQFLGCSQKCVVMTKDKQLQSVTFDYANKSARLSEILIDVNMIEFVISHTEKYILARSTRCLYLIDSQKERLRHSLQRMPPGVFVETMSTFTGAGFSPNDDLVVASRYTYVAVWNAKNGQPVRLLQAAISPILKIFTSSKVNKAVSLLRDNTVQVWNLDNLDKDVLHANEVVGGTVKGLAVCSRTSRVVCHGHNHPEVKVVDLADGRTENTIEYSQEEGARVEKVELSPRGNWLVTRGHRATEEEEEEEDRSTPREHTWPHLFDDIIWDMNTYNKLYEAHNSRYVMFQERHPVWSPHIGLVTCTRYDPYDWTNNQHSLTLLDVQGANVSSRTLPLPPNTEFLCPPLFFCELRKDFTAVVSVVQTCKVPDRKDPNQTRTYDVKLLISRLGDAGFVGEESIRVADLLKHADPWDRFVLAHNRHDTWVLLHYVKGVEHFEFDYAKGCLACPPGLLKGSMLYDPIKRIMMKHFPYVLTPESDLALTQFSRHFSTSLDNHLQVFNKLTNTKTGKLSSDLLQPSSVRMALDGRYVVGLTPDLRALLVVRPSDLTVKGRLFIHGKAACVEVAENDRTIVVGCQDGRVMIVSLILEFCDPVMEFVQHLPSRSRVEAEVKDMLQEDVTQISSVAADLRRLSLSVQEKKRTQMRKPCFLAVSNAALITLHANRQRSQACSIQ